MTTDQRSFTLPSLIVIYPRLRCGLRIRREPITRQLDEGRVGAEISPTSSCGNLDSLVDTAEGLRPWIGTDRYLCLRSAPMQGGGDGLLSGPRRCSFSSLTDPGSATGEGSCCAAIIVVVFDFSARKEMRPEQHGRGSRVIGAREIT